jgi:hypothetical protein
MKKTKIFLLIILLGLVLSLTACSGKNATPTPAPPALAPVAVPVPTSGQDFPATVEDSLFAALAFYRKEGFDALKQIWLTDEFGSRSAYADFLATTVNDIPTSPAALMGWEILNVNLDDPGASPAGTMRLLVKTSYQGGGLVCRWMKFATPAMTGNHWRISDNQNVPCEGQASAQTNPQGNPQATVTPEPSATGGQLFWYPCPNLPASAIQIGSTVYVNPEPPLAINVRLQPSEGSEVMGRINPGDLITIGGGPACADQRVWWQVHMKTELTPGSGSYEEYDGWISEMLDNSNYLLLPCPVSGPCGGGFIPRRTQFVPPDWLTARAK